MSEKVLIVDDDLETLRLVGLMLQRQGYEIAAAHNGTQAIQMARAQHPDLIVLDVMMPDMDGYQVTRQLREFPETTSIPILMFTAKSQVDDKMMGYEAGVDDYLTKPIHPAELVARIRALLVRGRSRGAAAQPPKAERGYLIGVIAPRGGLGTSSLVLNLAVSFYQRTKKDVVAAELRPGHGSWAMDLGFSSPDSLNKILRMKPSEITPDVIGEELLRTTFGPQLLMASYKMKDCELFNASGQMQALVQQLPFLAPMVLADIGAPLFTQFENTISLFQEIFVVTEPFPGTVQRTRLLIEELKEKGFGRSKFLNVIIMNRIRADIQLSVTQVSEMLDRPIAQVIPPAPEMAYQATLRSLPLVSIQPDGLVAQQFIRIADMVAERITK